MKRTQIHYPLPVHNYNRLIHPYPSSPQLLVVVFIPKSLSSWVNSCEERTTLQRSAYWISLRGKEKTENSDNITVHIPRQNLLTPQSLQEIMQRIASKDL